jgi:hypothetical protein
MRKLVLKLCFIIIPVAILVCGSNYYVDPANRFAPMAYIGGIADILSKGHNVDNLTNYNERLLQEEMIKRLQKRPDIIVLGSSRIMEVGSGLFPGKTLLNCGVSHANLDDVIALVGALDSLEKLPREFVVGVDPYLISQGGSTEWETLFPYHRSFIKKLEKEETLDEEPLSFYNKWSSACSFDYFKSTVEFVRKRKSKRYLDVGLQPPLSGRFSDGTVSYPTSYTNPDTIKVALDARNTGLAEGLPLQDTVRVKRLNRLLDFFKDRGIAVRFVMTPFHPAFYAAINEGQPGLFKQYETFFTDLATRRNIAVTGGFDARPLGISIPRFYDMYHCSREAIAKIFNEQVPEKNN